MYRSLRRSHHTDLIYSFSYSYPRETQYSILEQSGLDTAGDLSQGQDFGGLSFAPAAGFESAFEASSQVLGPTTTTQNDNIKTATDKRLPISKFRQV